MSIQNKLIKDLIATEEERLYHQKNPLHMITKFTERLSFVKKKDMSLMPIQKKTLQQLQDRLNDTTTTQKTIDIALAGGRGVGKSRLSIYLLIWGLISYSKSNPNITMMSCTHSQLLRTLFKELKACLIDLGFLNNNSYKHMFSDANNYIQYNNAKIITKNWKQGSSKEAEASIQGEHSDFTLSIVDEAVGVPDYIFQAISGSMIHGVNILCTMANPSKTSGAFYDFFHEKSSTAITANISAYDCRTIDKESEGFKKLLARCKTEDLKRIYIYGQFPKQNGGAFFNLQFIEQSLNILDYNTFNLIDFNNSVLGIDIATGHGEDDTVIAVRTEKAIYIKDVLKCTLPELHQRLLQWKARNPDTRFAIDSVAVGEGVVQRLASEGIYAKSVISNAKPMEDGDYCQYHNLRSELYGKVKDYIENDLPIYCPYEYLERLKSEFLLTEHEYTDIGKIKIKDKKKTHNKSPDILDAISYCFASYLPIYTKRNVLSNIGKIF